MGAYLAYDLVTDLPLWYGGAYVLGWAFRPVHLVVEVLQLKDCEQDIWKDEEVVILEDRKELEAYPEAQRSRKEVQLKVNLNRAIRQVSQWAGQTLRLQPCPEAQL